MLNPNEAPSDMIAVESTGVNNVCGLCHYRNTMCPDVPCMRHKRKDGQDVYFKFHQPQPDLLNAATHEQRKPHAVLPADEDFSDHSSRQIEAAWRANELIHPPRKLQCKQTVTISAELSTADVALRRAVEIQISENPIGTCHALKTAYEQVLRAGGGSK